MSLFTIINVIIIIIVIKNVTSFPLKGSKRLGSKRLISSHITRRTSELHVFAPNGTASSSNNQYQQFQLQLQLQQQQQQQQQYSEDRLRSELMSAIDSLKDLLKLMDSNNKASFEQVKTDNKESLSRIETKMNKMETDNKASFEQVKTDNKASFEQVETSIKAIDTKFTDLDKKVTILQILLGTLFGFLAFKNLDIKNLLSVLLQFIKFPSL